MNYAVIELSGAQFLVSEGDKLKVNRLSQDEGKSFSLLPLLLVSEGEVSVGQPNVEEVQVELKVLEHKKDKKIYVRRFKSKSRYRRKKGHRQPITIVEVVKIAGAEASNHGKVEKKTEEVKTSRDLTGLEISARTKNALKKAGIKTTDELKKMSREELLGIKGVGGKAVKELEKAFNTKY